MELDNSDLLERIVLYDAPEAKCPRCKSAYNISLISLQSNKLIPNTDERSRIFRIDAMCNDCHKDFFILVARFRLMYHKLPNGAETYFLKALNPFINEK